MGIDNVGPWIQNSKRGYIDSILLISWPLWTQGIDTVVTKNTKEFKKFDHIEFINPFPHFAMPSEPMEKRTIPYGRQSIDEKDLRAVCSVLRSDWLTTGPKVAEFEQAVADYVGAKQAIAVSSGTAALHCAMNAIGIGPGDEVIVPTMTFVATANCVVFQGATPVFVDVNPDTLLIDPSKLEAKVTPKTKAITAVDYTGQPCEYDRLHVIAEKHGLKLVTDGCHALGAEYKGKKVGSLSHMTVFSFHPVKHITSGEGGMIVTDDENLAEQMRIFRNHGITTDHRQRELQNTWRYSMELLGYNYRITDIQCALGISQLLKLEDWIARRQEIAALYDESFATIDSIMPLRLRSDVLPAKDYAKLKALTSMPSTHAYHLYVIRLKGLNRDQIFNDLRVNGIGVNVHYLPVHLHPFYKNNFGTGPGLCPVAENAYGDIISLPIFPSLTNDDVEYVIRSVKRNIL